MSKKTILTGDRPTGKLHLGHYTGSLKNRVALQNEDKYNMFVMIADQQALTDNAKNPKKIVDNLLEVIHLMLMQLLQQISYMMNINNLV